MKNLVFLLFLLISLKACSQEKTLDKKIFVPDTTINNKLILLDKKSVFKNLGEQSGKLINDDKASRIQFKNESNNEYLILYHLSGSNANTFNKFEVGILKDNMQSFKDSPFDSFYSENKIRLGITFNDLIKIKGASFTKSSKDGFVIVKYSIEDTDNSFLKRHDMPIYISEYYFKGDKLNKFIFGFPNL